MRIVNMNKFLKYFENYKGRYGVDAYMHSFSVDIIYAKDVYYRRVLYVRRGSKSTRYQVIKNEANRVKYRYPKND